MSFNLTEILHLSTPNQMRVFRSSGLTCPCVDVSFIVCSDEQIPVDWDWDGSKWGVFFWCLEYSFILQFCVYLRFHGNRHFRQDPIHANDQLRQRRLVRLGLGELLDRLLGILAHNLSVRWRIVYPRFWLFLYCIVKLVLYIIPSSEAVANQRPFDWKARAVTLAVWPEYVWYY